MTRAIAIDWSGAKKPKGKIWTAMSEQGRLVEFVPAATREKAISWLLEHLKNCPTAIAGLDFAFSMPRWFVEKKGVSTAGDFWALVEREGEDWLHRCEPPFWGRPGKRKPDLDQHFRRTEERVDGVGGIKPKSVFQVGGAGAVGTSSIRGMPFLSKIRDAGVSVWPFDPPIRPMAVEIYPRLFTGAVVKSDCSARFNYLNQHYPDLKTEHRTQATDSEDAFDAAVSALELEKTLDTAPYRDDVSLIEGEIWPGRTV